MDEGVGGESVASIDSCLVRAQRVQMGGNRARRPTDDRRQQHDIN